MIGLIGTIRLTANLAKVKRHLAAGMRTMLFITYCQQKLIVQTLFALHGNGLAHGQLAKLAHAGLLV